MEQGFIGLFDHRPGGQGGAGLPQRDAATQGHLVWLAGPGLVCDGGPPHRLANALGRDADGIGPLAVGDEQEELLPAVAVRTLAGTHDQIDARGDVPKRLVTRHVTVVVVEQLEMVDVEDGYPVRPSRTHRPRRGSG